MRCSGRNVSQRAHPVLGVTAKSLRRMPQITRGITANISHIISNLAVEGT
ncbi:hypothetical protein AB395_00003965 [Sinorhizobium fredii CCBAU 45436]|nr:hypothetical protein AB395_00003965 [Sinorhizobium fredii CCBAU 45436]